MTYTDILLEKILQPFIAWFENKGWRLRTHQITLLEKARQNRSVLLIAPTGAGKTLAGFLPSLVSLSHHKKGKRGLHTLYISPLKSLTVDIERNLLKPIEEMALPVKVEARTGDTPSSKRRRQILSPPDILLTTPEQLALLLASKEANSFFSDLQRVIIDEIHIMVTSKRGHLLALNVARLHKMQPSLAMVGLSATVSNPENLAQWLMPQKAGGAMQADLVIVEEVTKPHISILETSNRLPWAGHMGHHAHDDIYKAIKSHRLTLVFVNTRAQAERLFNDIWHINADNLAIALHHGSLDVSQRRRVEAAMSSGALKAVICTATLDMGIDWGNVDLVITVGAPKGASRLAQRIGRANHRFDEPSKAYLIPVNCFEVLECMAALDANYLGDQDTPPLQKGALDVLAQHVLATACHGPFHADELFDEVRSCLSYQYLEPVIFEKIIDFVAHGGYALKAYERFQKIKKMPNGRYRLTHPHFAQHYNLNVGTIIENSMLTIRLARVKKGQTPRGGKVLGKVEDYFLESLSPGDTFLFAGQVLKLEAIRDMEAYVSKAASSTPKVPSYLGGKFPLSTYLADKVRVLLSNEEEWHRLPDQVSKWLFLQKEKSFLPTKNELLIETFPRAKKHYLVVYPFEGRLAHQTLGMLLTRRLEHMGLKPLGFVATDYVLAIWGLEDMASLDFQRLFHEDLLGDDLEEWLVNSALLKRTFKNCALISGLIEKNHINRQKTGRQITFSSDLIYDVLREHDPTHILLKATYEDAAEGLLDIRRLSDMLSRVRGQIVHKALNRISPLAVPIMLEVGREPIYGASTEALLEEASQELLYEATR